MRADLGRLLSNIFTLFGFLADNRLFFVEKSFPGSYFGHIFVAQDVFLEKRTVLMMTLLGRAYLVKMREDRLISISFLRFDSPRLSFCVNTLDN